MAGKRKRTREHDVRDVLLYLITHGKSTNKQIAESLKINKGLVSSAVNEDLNFYIAITRGNDGRSGYISLVYSPLLLQKVVHVFARDPDSLREILMSDTYRDWKPKIVNQFDAAMPLHDIHTSKRWAEGSYDIEDNVYYLADTYNKKANPNDTLCCVIEFCKDRAHVTFDLDGLSDEDMEVLNGYLAKHGLQLSDNDVFEDTTEKPADHLAHIQYTTDSETVGDKIIMVVKNHLSDEDKQCLTMSLEDNWLTLKFCIHFIAAKHGERERILDKINRDAGDPHISPWAAWEQGFDAALKQVEHTVVDAEALRPVYVKRQKERQDEPLNNWIEFFDQLDHLNSAYPFLWIRTETT